MRSSWPKGWPIGLLALSLVLGGCSTLNLWWDVGKPFGGFLPSHNIMADHWLIGMPTPAWWPGMSQAGLAYGDRLLELGNRPYGAHQPRVYVTAYASPSRSVQLAVIRAGTRIEIELPVVPFTPSSFLDVRLPTGITGLGFWLLALVVYRAQPGEPLSRLSTTVSCLMAIAFWLPHSSLFPHVGPLTRILDFVLYVVVSPLLGASVLHFALLFPNTSCLYRPLVSRFLYIVAFCFIVPYAASRLLLWSVGWSSLVGVLDRVSFKGYIYLLGAGVLLLLLRLGWTILRPGVPRRLQHEAIIVILGLLVTFPAMLVTGLKLLSGRSLALYWHSLDLRYLYLAIPLTLAFVILRYNAFRSMPRLFLFVMILTSASFLASIGAWCVRLIQPQSIDYSLAFLPILGVALAAGSIWSTQGSWRGVFGRLLHWEVHTYDAARRFGQRVVGHHGEKPARIRSAVTLHSLAGLPSQVVEALVAELQLERAAIWLRKADGTRFEIAAHAGRWAQPPPSQPPIETNLLLSTNQPLRVKQRNEVANWLSTSETVDRVEVLIPLSAAEQLIGLMALGNRWDEEILDERDLQVMELIAQQVSLFLLTASQVEELSQVPRRLAEAQKRERARIAQELHDTVQQFLGGLPFYLESSCEMLRTEPDQAEALLRACLEEI